MKKYSISMVFFFLAASGFLPAEEDLSAFRNPYAITLDFGYGRPFNSIGYSGRDSVGFDGGLSFEYRVRDVLSLGLGYDQIVLSDGNISTSSGMADLFARFLPFGMGRFEPYGLIGVGGMLSATSTDSLHMRSSSYDARLALGLLYSLNTSLAFDFALGYHISGPTGQDLNYTDLRVGLQTLFGGKAAPDPSPTANLKKK